MPACHKDRPEANFARIAGQGIVRQGLPKLQKLLPARGLSLGSIRAGKPKTSAGSCCPAGCHGVGRSSLKMECLLHELVQVLKQHAFIHHDGGAGFAGGLLQGRFTLGGEGNDRQVPGLDVLTE
jgi:hypothetical protein